MVRDSSFWKRTSIGDNIDRNHRYILSDHIACQSVYQIRIFLLGAILYGCDCRRDKEKS